MLNAQINEVFDINKGSGNSGPTNFIVFDGKLYFSADDISGENTGGEDKGRELWVTDGTAGGTNLVKDIRVGSSNGSPFAFFIFNNKLYFSANDGTGSDLWTTDGTDAGTTKIDLFPGVTEAVQRAIELDGKVYMTGISTTGDTNDLIVWDGTTATNANTTANDESILSTMAVLNGKLLMYASYEPDDATVDNELYEFDPTTGVFKLIKDIDPGTQNSSISNLTTLGSKVYFEADNELWETDGTEAGTIKVLKAEEAGVNNVTNFYAWDNKMFFEGDDGTGDQLWVYNPSANSVSKISNISGTNNNHDPSDYVAYDGYLYYKGEDANDTSSHLFRTNGTTVEQLDNTITDVDDLVLFNDKIYFEGDNGTTGRELFSINLSTLSIDNIFNASVSVFPNPSADFIKVNGDFNDVVRYKW